MRNDILGNRTEPPGRQYQRQEDQGQIEAGRLFWRPPGLDKFFQ